jgi:hypothetical protein
MVHWSACRGRIRDFRYDALPVAAPGLANGIGIAIQGYEVFEACMQIVEGGSMLRQFFVGGSVSVFNIVIQALVMTIVVRVAQTGGAQNRSHPSLPAGFE